MRLMNLIAALLMLAMPVAAVAQTVPQKPVATKKSRKAPVLLLTGLGVLVLVAVVAGSGGHSDKPKPISP